MSTLAPERRRGFAIVTLAYLNAVLVGWVLVRWSGFADAHPLWVLAIADVGATTAVFGWSGAQGNSSMYDPYWSAAPPVLAGWLALHPQAVDAVGPRQALVLALLCVWGLRLTYNWARGWQGLRHEDWRYVDLRRSTGRLYWLVSLLGLHLMPTVLVFLGCLPLWPALVVGVAPLSWLDGAAALV